MVCIRVNRILQNIFGNNSGSNEIETISKYLKYIHYLFLLVF